MRVTGRELIVESLRSLADRACPDYALWIKGANRRRRKAVA